MNAETAATGTMPRLCIMALVALVLLAFGSSLFNTFVIDDEYILLNNYAIRRLGNLPLVFTGEYFTAFAEQSYRPVCTLSYILDYQLFTLRPLGYHLHNVLLHTLNAVLVFAIARGMLGNLTGSFLTAGLFAVHTISGEAVNGIGFREDLQVVLLMLAACWACLRWCDHPRPVWIAVVWLASFLCVITKENGIVMPILLAGVLAAKRGRRFWKGAGVLCAGALLAWGASVAIRFVFMTFPAGAGELALTGSIPERLVKIVKIQGIYVQSLFYLTRFLPDFGAESLNADLDLSFARSIAAGAALLVWTAALRDRRAWIAAAFYLVAMGPTSNLHLLNNPIAFRYLYFPALGLYVLVGLSVSKLLDAWNVRPAARGIALAFLLIPPALYSLNWNAHWRDNLALWTYVTRFETDSFRIWSSLAAAQNNAGDYEAAAESARRSLELKPDYFYGLIALGISQLYSGQHQDAIAAFEKALEQPSTAKHKADVCFSIGFAAESLEDPRRARSAYEAAVKLDPSHSRALTNLGLLELQAGEKEPGRAHLEQAVHLDPRNAAAHFNLGILALQEHRLEDARRSLERAARLEPGNAQVREILRRLETASSP